MPADTEALLAKIQALPVDRLAEVDDFVATKSRRLTALDRLLAIVPALEAAGAPPMTEKDIAAELEAVRAARRSRSTGADRT